MRLQKTDRPYLVVSTFRNFLIYDFPINPQQTRPQMKM